MKKLIFCTGLILSIVVSSFSQNISTKITDKKLDDFLTPEYYLSNNDDDFRKEVNRFVYFARKIPFSHPLSDSLGNHPEFFTPGFGTFGAGKGPTRTEQHHPAIDFKVGRNETNVAVFASHDGFVNVYRDAPKYRHYISVTCDVKDEKDDLLGKMVSIYGHVDLDLDSAQSILPNGKFVKRGELISQNLYSGTRGGPHLHFEIRYYRKTDKGTEEFYGFKRKNGSKPFTQPSAGSRSFGVWNSVVGYGYANPENHLKHNGNK